MSSKEDQIHLFGKLVEISLINFLTNLLSILEMLHPKHKLRLEFS